MKEALLSTMLIALMAAAGTSTVFAQTPHPRTSKVSPAETEVRRANTEEVDAFLQNDPKAMDRLWSEDFVVTNPLNKFVTKQQVLGMVHAGVLVITSSDRQIEYLRVYGDTVIVAGNETVVWGGKMPNAGKTEHLRFTGIWMKRRGHWQEVARHANIVPQVTVSRTNSTSATRSLATVAFGRNPALGLEIPLMQQERLRRLDAGTESKQACPATLSSEVPNHTYTHPRDFASTIGAAVSAVPIPRLRSVGVTLATFHRRGAK